MFRVVLIVFFCVFFSFANDLQTSKQIWGNLILGKNFNDKLFVELDIEPKSQIDGVTKWHNVDVTPLVEYYPNGWVDLTLESVFGYTKENVNREIYEISPRIGIRFHIFGNLREYIPAKYLITQKHFSMSSLFRYEYRTLYYSNTQTERQSRFRMRLETKTAINHSNHAADDTFYIFADIEEYFDIGKDIQELFHNKTRLRLGPAYTFTKKNRLELLFIYDFAYDTSNGSRRRDVAAVDLRYKLYF